MDARTRYTKSVIRKVFLQLLNEKPLNKITVKEISDVAQINRATFYKYYENPYDLLTQLEKEQMDILQDKIQQMEQPALSDIFRVVLQELKENAPVYQVMFSENGDKSFKQRIFALCYNDNIKTIEALFPELDAKRQEWLYYFIAEGCNGILNQWVEENMESPIEEIISFAEQAINAINTSFVEMPD